ncbi:uncharacterized protein LOC143267018 [Peromyscus maniculatus bairdii]|uniref:uncharacterized protein LOC143267018 n=1 Tax=Peromyscus maniculatus bairdii TaxID=230844 RepID=UPI003FD40145
MADKAGVVGLAGQAGVHTGKVLCWVDGGSLARSPCLLQRHAEPSFGSLDRETRTKGEGNTSRNRVKNTESGQSEGTIPQRGRWELASETSLLSACPHRKEGKVPMGPQLTENMFLHLGVPGKPLFPSQKTHPD